MLRSVCMILLRLLLLRLLLLELACALQRSTHLSLKPWRQGDVSTRRAPRHWLLRAAAIWICADGRRRCTQCTADERRYHACFIRQQPDESAPSRALEMCLATNVLEKRSLARRVRVARCASKVFLQAAAFDTASWKTTPWNCTP